MPSLNCELAIETCHRVGNALLKFVSANDVNATGGHQTGFYLPKRDDVWPMFTTRPPRGENHKTDVDISWQAEEYPTTSTVTWYGNKTRREYRLTRFGRKFPYLSKDAVGNLLVLIPTREQVFRAFLLDLEEDIDELQAALGIEIGKSWAIYRDGVAQEETENECIEREFRKVVGAMHKFPSGEVFSQAARRVLAICIRESNGYSADIALTKWMDCEYRLFKMAERALCTNEVTRLFKDIDEFLKTASAIMNRRKSRAGRSLENHVQALLLDRRIPHAMRDRTIEGKPDIVIPSVEAYNDPAYPVDKLFIVGVKTTCKDRWRQVLHEARRVPHKHILTLQPGISSKQLSEMHEARVSLIVPIPLHAEFPRHNRIEILSVEAFLNQVSRTLTR